ncbi:MAG: hypothetical protein AAF268_07565 [Cyanobacteria bacterium P01_A01_bin.3]
MSDQRSTTSKQKVTFYLSPELHRTTKVQAAVECDSMSSIIERALRFYLEHPDVVEGAMGQAHQVHSCPACESSFVMRQGMPQLISQQAAILDDSVTAEAVRRRAGELQDDGQPDLVTC